MLDADIRGFFDTIAHDWLEKMIEHRVGDRRITALIRKWLRAGVMEEGKLKRSEEGTPQGGLVSPVLANIYLHYVFDQWVQQWRKREARGAMIIVRYADDFVVGFEHREEAERFQGELRERMRKFELELHEEKTRLIEFGKHAVSQRRRRGEGKPDVQLSWLHAHLREDARGSVCGNPQDDAEADASEAERPEEGISATDAH